MPDSSSAEKDIFQKIGAGIKDRLRPGGKISNRPSPPNQQPEEKQAPAEKERPPEKLWGYTSIEFYDPTFNLVLLLRSRGLDIRSDSSTPKVEAGKPIKGQEVAIYGTPQAIEVLDTLRQTPEFGVVQKIVDNNNRYYLTYKEEETEQAIRNSGWDAATKQQVLVLLLCAQISGSNKVIIEGSRRSGRSGDFSYTIDRHNEYEREASGRIKKMLGQEPAPKIDEYTIKDILKKVIDMKLPPKAPHPIF